MNKRVLAAGIVVAAVAVTLGIALANNDAPTPLPIGEARLVDPAGGSLGTLQLAELEGRLNVTGNVRGLAAGFHGFHFHENGQCVGSSTPPFASAGEHLRAADETHPGHAGDMPVLLVGEDGTVQVLVTTDRVTRADVLDSDGSAIIVHAGPDNYANIPTRYAPEGPDAATLATGDSGGRVACGVVTPL